MINIATFYDDMSTVKKLNKNMLEVMEDALDILELRMDRIYNIASINSEFIKRNSKIKDINLNEFNIDEIKKVFDKKSITKSFYTKIKKRDKINSILINIFNKEFITAIYLVAIGSW